MSLKVEWIAISGNNPPVNFTVRYRDISISDGAFRVWSNNQSSMDYEEHMLDIIQYLNESTSYDILIDATNMYTKDNTDDGDTTGITRGNYNAGYIDKVNTH